MRLCDLPLATVSNFSGKSLILPALIPQTALHGLWSDHTNSDEPIIDHVEHVCLVLLIFKLLVYNSREGII